MGSKSGSGKKKKSSASKKAAPAKGVEEETSSDIRCVCGNNVDKGMMIQCETCLLWQHGECFGMETGSDIPENYFCELCRPDLHKDDPPVPMDESPLEDRPEAEADPEPEPEPTPAPEKKKRTSQRGSRSRSRASTNSPPRKKRAKPTTEKAQATEEELVGEVIPELEFVSAVHLRNELSRDLVEVRDLVKAKNRNKLGVLSTAVGRDLLEKYALMFAADEHGCDGKDFVRALAFVFGFEPIRLIDYLMRLAEEVRNNEDNYERYCGDPMDPFSGWKIEEGKQEVCSNEGCPCHTVFVLPEKVELARSSVDQKWSLCSCAETPSGEILCQYRGVIGEAAGIMRNVRRSRSYLLDHDVPYIEYTQHGEDMIGIDARKQGNTTRFVRRSCQPNAELKAMDVHGNTVMVLIAKKDLSPGEEVTVGYPFEPKGTLKSSAPCACPKAQCNVSKWYKKRKETVVKELQGIEQFRVFASLQSSVAAVAPSVSAPREPVLDLPRPQVIPTENLPTPANLESSLNPYSTPQGKMSREERKIMQYMRSFEKMENRGGKKKPGEPSTPPTTKPRVTTPKKKTTPKKQRQTPPSGPRLPAKRQREEKATVEIVSPKKRKPSPAVKAERQQQQQQPRQQLHPRSPQQEEEQQQQQPPHVSKGLASSPFPKIRRTVSQETCLAKLNESLKEQPKLPIGKVGKKAYLMYRCSQGPGNGVALADHGDYVKPHNAKKLILHKFMAVKRNKGGTTRISLHSSTSSTGSDSMDGLSPVLDAMDTTPDAAPASPSFQTFEQTRKGSATAVSNGKQDARPRSPEFTLKPAAVVVPSPVTTPARAGPAPTPSPAPAAAAAAGTPGRPPPAPQRPATTPQGEGPLFKQRTPAADSMPEFKQRPAGDGMPEFRTKSGGDTAMPDFKPKAAADMPDFRARSDTDMMYSNGAPPADYRRPPADMLASQGPPPRKDMRGSYERPLPVLGRGQPFDRSKPRGWDSGDPGLRRSPVPMGMGREPYSSPAAGGYGGGMGERPAPSPRGAIPSGAYDPYEAEEDRKGPYYGRRKQPAGPGGPVMQYSGAGAPATAMPGRGRGGPSGWGQGPPSRSRPEEYGHPPYAGRGRPYVSTGHKGDNWRH